MKIGNTSNYSKNLISMQGDFGNNQDNAIKNIKNQISDVQKQLKEISGNKELSAESKTSKHKELQDNLQELNKQLTQRQMEIQKENRKKKSEESVNKTEKEEQNSDKIANGLSAESMIKIVDSQNSLKQAKITKSIHSDISGKVEVLKVEIKLDEARQIPESENSEFIQKKKNNLDKLEAHANDIISEFSDEIGNINKKINDIDSKKNTVNEKNMEDSENQKPKNEQISVIDIRL